MLQKQLYTIFSIAACAVFIARGIQYYWYDAPFRILVWDENLMQPILEKYFSMSWEDWVSHPENEELIVAFAKKISLLYLAAAACCLLLLTRLAEWRWFKFISYSFLWLGFFNLLLLYFLYSKDKNYRPSEFLEFALQWGSPLLVIFYHYIKINYVENILKVLCVAVFLSHGLLAIGYYPTPVNYISMTMNGLHCSEALAKNFLLLMGILDMVFSIGVFFSKILKISILYFITWGFLTSISRLYCNWYGDMWELSMQQYFHEMLVRVPHFLIPFGLLLVFMSKKSQNAA